MKIAIVHDSFLHVGGAEKVFYKFIETYPDADVFVPLINKKYLDEINQKTNGKLNISWINKILFFNEKFFTNYSFTAIIASLLKPLLIIYWETLNLKKYDLIISSSHSFSSKSVNKKLSAKHISYIHTPPKYLYNEYNRMNWIKKFPFAILLWPTMFLLRKYDYYSAQKPDLLIANSEVVQQRIKKYYKRNSVIIYPLFDIATHNIDKISPTSNKKNGKYFLFFSRLEKQKGAEPVIKTCTKHNIPLVVMGAGSQEKYLKKIAGKTIFFTGFVSQEQKVRIFKHTKALIYASIDEDFGMVIPEVASYGIPIIYYNSEIFKKILKTKDNK
jgi:glycosyltransferase involved in cell wall biosynthesis